MSAFIRLLPPKTGTKARVSDNKNKFFSSYLLPSLWACYMYQIATYDNAAPVAAPITPNLTYSSISVIPRCLACIIAIAAPIAASSADAIGYSYAYLAIQYPILSPLLRAVFLDEPLAEALPALGLDELPARPAPRGGGNLRHLALSTSHATSPSRT